MSEFDIDVSSSNSHFIRAQLAPTLANKELTIGVRELTAEEKKIVQELKRRDSEVRHHEQAHKSAAGSFARGVPKFEYVTGPDGKQYAVGGEMRIDTSKVVGNPEASLRKARAIKRAALAPRDPSIQDRRVAAEARQMEAKAKQELEKLKKEESPQSYTKTGETKENSISSNLDMLA